MGKSDIKFHGSSHHQDFIIVFLNPHASKCESHCFSDVELVLCWCTDIDHLLNHHCCW